MQSPQDQLHSVGRRAIQVSIGDFVEVTPPEEEQKDGDGLDHFYVVRVTEMFQDAAVSLQLPSTLPLSLICSAEHTKGAKTLADRCQTT